MLRQSFFINQPINKLFFVVVSAKAKASMCQLVFFPASSPNANLKLLLQMMVSCKDNI